MLLFGDLCCIGGHAFYKGEEYEILNLGPTNRNGPSTRIMEGSLHDVSDVLSSIEDVQSVCQIHNNKMAYVKKEYVGNGVISMKMVIN